FFLRYMNTLDDRGLARKEHDEGGHAAGRPDRDLCPPAWLHCRGRRQSSCLPPSMTTRDYYSVSIRSQKPAAADKGVPIVQVLDHVDQVLDPETAPDTIEATLNYIVDDGTKIFTETAAPGATDVRSGGKPDPRRVTIRNGRHHTGEFTLERNGFHFVHHDTAV